MKSASEKSRAPRARKTSAVKPRDWTDQQRQRIAELAYRRFVARGGQHGYELEDWLEAEKEFAAGGASAKRTRAARTAKA